MDTTTLVLLSTFLLYCVKKYLDYRAAVKSIQYVAIPEPCEKTMITVI